MTEHWKEVRLGDVLLPVAGKRKTQRGWSPQCEASPASNDQWGVLRTTAVQMGWFEPGENKALPPDLVPRPQIEVAEGDLLLLTTGPRNRCGIPTLVDQTPGKLMMSGKMIRLRPNPEQAIGSWLLYFLLSARGQSELEKLKVGSSDSSVSIGADALTRIAIPLPHLDEQRRIVGELEEQIRHLGATRIRLERAKLDLEHFLAAALDRYFADSGQEEGRLGFMEAFEVLASPHPGYKQREYLANGAVPIVDQGKHLVAGYTNQTDRVIRAAEPVLVFGDHTRIVKYVDFDFAVGADGTKLLRAKTEILDHKFGYRLLQAVRIRNRGYARHFSELKKQQFSVPSLTKQRQVIGLFDEIESRVKQVQKRIDDSEESMETAKSSILHRAFSPTREGS